MSIFRRDPDPIQRTTPANTPANQSPAVRSAPARHAAPGKGATATHVASGTKVVGQISGSAELVVDGQVEGEIHLDSRVVIGASGRVTGEIQARAIEVNGKVHGNIRGAERVEVLASGGLEGDVVAPRVVIAEGAFFKGKVEMTDPSRRDARPPSQRTGASENSPARAAARSATKDAGMAGRARTSTTTSTKRAR